MSGNGKLKERKGKYDTTENEEKIIKHITQNTRASSTSRTIKKNQSTFNTWKINSTKYQSAFLMRKHTTQNTRAHSTSGNLKHTILERLPDEKECSEKKQEHVP